MHPTDIIIPTDEAAEIFRRGLKIILTENESGEKIAGTIAHDCKPNVPVYSQESPGIPMSDLVDYFFKNSSGYFLKTDNNLFAVKVVVTDSDKNEFNKLIA